MNDIKNQVTLLTVIGVSTLIVSIIATSLAWFSIDELKKEDPVIIEEINNSLYSVTFENGNDININDSTEVIKKFKISQTDKTSIDTVNYKIKLIVENNTVSENKLFQSLTSTGNNNGGTLLKLENEEVPKETIVIGNGTIDGYETHEYEYKFYFKEPLLNQNENFKAKIEIELES